MTNYSCKAISAVPLLRRRGRIEWNEYYIGDYTWRCTRKYRCAKAADC